MHRPTHFKVDAASHAQRRKWVYDLTHERGGNLYVGKDMHTLFPCTTQDDGKRNSIRYRRGPVDWHTHPAPCLGVDNCVMGLPSVPDLVNVCTGAHFDNLFHLLYSREGTYVLQMSPKLRQHMQTHRPSEKHLSSRIKAALQGPRDAYRERRISYKACQAAYISRLRALGIVVRLFRDDTIPVVKIDHSIPVRAPSCTYGSQ